MTRTARAALLLLIASLVLPAGARPNTAGALSPDLLKQRITYLASDALAGRGSGTPGNDQAARYIAAAFRRAGLRPVGTARQSDISAPMDGSGYFQPFTFVSGVAEGRRNSLEARFGGRVQAYRVGSEFEPSGVSGSATARGEVIFAGYGIRSREPQRDDYAGIDVHGKIVLVLAGAPGANPHSPLWEFAGIRRKALTARDLGAAAMLVVLPRESDAPRMETDDSPSGEGLPILVVRRSVANEWLRSTGRPLDTLEPVLADTPTAFATGVRVFLTADVKKVVKTTANIAGLLEGSDPALKDEVVVIGAHMDHLGMGGPGSLAEDRRPAIHHGADDNASGAAGVMALADYFCGAIRPVEDGGRKTDGVSWRPKRSLLFICFSGEELGLLGSAHYVKHPFVPLERTVAMVNMDMIGRLRNDKLTVVGSGTSSAWPAVLDEANRRAGFTLARDESGFGASDQQSFYAAHIPVLFFFTGIHPDYHKPSDTADKINAMGESRVLEMVAECVREIADMPARPDYQEIREAQAGPSRSFRVSLGTIPDYSAEAEGVTLSGVRPGSAAERAGLRQGDVIVKFGDRSIRNIQDYTIALSERNPGDVVTIVVKRGGQEVTLTATLESPRRQ